MEAVKKVAVARAGSPFDQGYHTLGAGGPPSWEDLTDDLWLRIFSFLTSDVLCVVARVCRRWYFLAWDARLWRTLAVGPSSQLAVDRGLRCVLRLLARENPAPVRRALLPGCARLSDRGLAALAQRCPALEALDVRGCSRISTAGVAEVLVGCPRLSRLDLAGCWKVTGLAAPGSQLTHLDLTDCTAVTDDAVAELVCHCPQLESLFLRRCPQLTDVAARVIAGGLAALRDLSLSGCPLLTDLALHDLARFGPALRYLSVARCDRCSLSSIVVYERFHCICTHRVRNDNLVVQVSDAGLRPLCRRCPRLRYLNVRGCEAVSDASLEVAPQSLRALDAGKCDVTDTGLQALARRCPTLRRLSLQSCEAVSDVGLQALAYHCRTLLRLSIQDCPAVTAEGCRAVRRLCRRCIIEHTNPGLS
ncbi:FBXL7 [Cordylochernes scorpioides]|uniref:FBXL7 n=1 Tax=Cordylochernes scorpioides TaxID=51811 RepID=A0ABY6JYR0_9ARAC|nr:FBXL7 [Cordylochernes scorpioides]